MTKAIIITGKKDEGKSTTIREVVRELAPNNVFKILVEERKAVLASVDDIYNGSFIIECEGKYILIVAGCPTEQNVVFSLIWEICIELEYDISFIVCAKRTREEKKGFDTLTDVGLVSDILPEEKINKIDYNDFKQSDEWKERILNIVSLVKKELMNIA